MSRKKTTTTLMTPTPSAAIIEPKPEVRVPKSKTVSVELTAPVVEHGQVLLSRVECKLTPRQSKALRMLFDGLAAEGGTILLGGTRPEPVTSQHDAIRWVLDQIADAVADPSK